MPATNIKTISKDYASRAIYIDFEANPEHKPSILGVLYREDADGMDVFSQYVIEERLHPAGNLQMNRIIDEAIEEILDLSERENRLILAWSEKEIKDIEEYCRPDLYLRAKKVLKNAIPIAKRWHNVFYPGIRIPQTQYRGKHTQEYYMRLVGFSVPGVYGPGAASKPIRWMRDELRRREGNYNLVSLESKSLWRCMLKHNEYDCKGMQAIMSRVSRDMARRKHGYNGQTFRMAG